MNHYFWHCLRLIIDVKLPRKLFLKTNLPKPTLKSLTSWRMGRQDLDHRRRTIRPPSPPEKLF
jgi:hypothetical protein